MKKRVFCLLGYLFSVLPPLVATLICFPSLYERGDGARAVSLAGLTLLFLSLLPFWRRLKRLLHSPSAPMLWGIVFTLFYLARLVADEVVLISAIGLVGSVVGAILFRLGGVGRGGDRL